MRLSRPFRNTPRQTQRQGVTTVEVAITFPVLMLLVMLIFEMSRIMMVQQCLGFAAQQSSRRASLATTLTESQVVSTAQSCMLPVIPNNTSVVNVQVTPSSLASTSSGTPVVVDLQVALSDVSWVPGSILYFLGNPTLSAQAIQDRE